MTEYLLIVVSTVWVNNIVLSQFLGLCPFLGVSRKLETAMGMGLATSDAAPKLLRVGALHHAKQITGIIGVGQHIQLDIVAGALQLIANVAQG